MAEADTELDVAKAIRDGRLDSPQRFENLSLFAMRISGTGAAHRTDPEEYVWRDPEDYLSPAFLDRCNGMPVLLDHPTTALLNSEEYSNRTVGSILLPYVKGSEVWGIARIQDDATAELLQNVQMSTSPGVKLFEDGNQTIKLDDGSRLLVEGKPKLVCHLAICERGVWDKGRNPSGVDGGLSMAEKEGDEDKKPAATEVETKKEDAAPEKKADADSEDWKSKHDAMKARLDAFEAKEKERCDAEAKAKADADDEDEKKKEKADRAKADTEAMMKEKMDSLAAENAAIKALLSPRAPTDTAELAHEQARADAVAQGFGRRADAPLLGETPHAYRLRMLLPIKQHSAAWKDLDLSKLPPEALGIAADQIRADAMRAAENPADVPAGTLQTRKRRSETGHDIREFFGDQYTADEPFRLPPRFATFNPIQRGI